MAKILILFSAKGLAKDDNIPVKLKSKTPSTFIHTNPFLHPLIPHWLVKGLSACHHPSFVKICRMIN